MTENACALCDEGGLDLSILFATRNRARQLEATLAAYLELDTEGIAWELIVVDNGSSDETRQMLARMAERLPLVVLSAKGVGQNRARNVAMERLRGALVMFMDDDVLPDPGCARAYLDAASCWPDDAIFGARIVPGFPPEAPDWMRSPDFDFSTTAFARYEPAAAEGSVRRHPYGPSFAVRRPVIGPMCFNEESGAADRVLCNGGAKVSSCAGWPSGDFDISTYRVLA